MIDMGSDKILAALDRIASTSSKKEKEDLVKAYSPFPQFMKVLQAALDPLTTYGIADVPVAMAGAAPGANTFEDAPIWDVLNRLAKRQLTGNAAREEIQKWMTFLTPASAELFKRILLSDLRAGFGASTVNKAVKGAIKTYPYMRCSLEGDLKGKNTLDNWPWEQGVPSQEKADGMFMNVNHEIGGAVTLTSRAGTPFQATAFAAIAHEIRNTFPEGYQQHGEMLVEVDGAIAPRQISNGVLNRIESGGAFESNERPVFFVWDSVPLSAIQPKGKYELKGYKTRLTEIVRAIAAAAPRSVRLIPTRIVKSKAEAKAHAAELMKAGKEGTIVKHPDMPWADGTSVGQVKQKLEFDIELRLKSILPGDPNTKNAGRAGSITCHSEDGLLVVDVAVKNEAMRDAIDANPDAFLEQIMTVRGNMVLTPSESNPLHTIFLPRFVEDVVRTDKSDADTLARILEIEEAAKQGEALVAEEAVA